MFQMVEAQQDTHRGVFNSSWQALQWTSRWLNNTRIKQDNTLPETNIAPENSPSQEESSLAPLIFRCHISWQGEYESSLKNTQQGDVEIIEPPLRTKNGHTAKPDGCSQEWTHKKKTPLVLLLIKQGYMNLSEAKLQVVLNVVFF